jgi:hypothetical protein
VYTKRSLSCDEAIVTLLVLSGKKKEFFRATGTLLYMQYFKMENTQQEDTAKTGG